MAQFAESLRVGNDIERCVLQFIRNEYPGAVKIVGKFKGYDIWIPEIAQSVEVKSDQKSQYTGNVVIEIEMYGRPSGLLTTKADWWLIYTGLKYYWIRPDKLKEKIILRNKPYVSFTGKGDTTPKKAYLIPVYLFERWAEKIDNK